MKIAHVMDQSSLRGGDFEIDLENGDRSSDGNGGETHNLSGQILSPRGKTSRFDQSFVNDEEKLSCKLEEQRAEKKTKAKLPKKPESTRPSKPPRPPRGPSLDASDLILVKEISELSILKRKRIQRLRTLHKVKKEKASPMKSSLFAMAVTILFFVVIICQA